MRRCLLVLILCAGCDVLFPELDSKSASSSDLATATVEDGGTPEITGLLCVLGDVRDPRSCATGVPSGMHVDVEETRDSASVDSTGAFTLPLSQTLKSATLAAADPTGSYLPSVIVVKLTNGRALGLAVPVVAQQTVQNSAFANGVPLDTSRGTLFAWAVDANGNAEAGARAALSGAAGPFYDGADPGLVTTQATTGPHGLIAFYNVAGGTAQLAVAHPSGATEQFMLPIRADAVTFTLLIP